MKRRRSPAPILLDQFSRPMSYGGLTPFYEGADRFPDGDSLTWLYSANRDTDSDLPESDLTVLRQSARRLFANAPVLKGVMIEQAGYSFPLNIHYTGKDTAWGMIAKSWLYHWDKCCDLRGEPFDCHTGSRLRLIGRRVDGDIALIIVLEDGQPRLQMIRSHRICDGNQEKDKDNRLKAGPWRGWRVKNGVVVNDFDRLAAIIIRGARKEDDQFIPESPAQLKEYGGLPPVRLIYDPLHCDQNRGMTSLEASIKMFRSHAQWHTAEMRAQVLQAKETFTEWNDAGEADPGPGDSDSDGVLFTNSAGLPALRVDNGQTRYYRSASGGKLELVKPDRPGDGVMRFDDKTLTEAIYGLGWDPNFALLLKEPGGANCRVMLDKVKRIIRHNQSIEARAQLWFKVWALSHAIQRKEIPAPKDGDITSWDFTGPPLPTADSGNDRGAKREEYKLGLLTAQTFFAEQDLWWEEQFEQRRLEVDLRLRHAEQLVAAHPELTLAEALQLLEQRYPNLPAVPAPEGEGQAKGDSADSDPKEDA